MSAASGIGLTMRVLRGTPNPAANDVLATALGSPDAEVRLCAVSVLAGRSDAGGQRRLLDSLTDATPDVRSAASKPAISKRLRKTVLRALKSEDTSLIKRACRYAIDAELYAALPVLAELGSDAEHPYGVGLATAALKLSRAMADHIEHGTKHEGDDPAFYRTTALQQLTRAAEAFGRHRRQELVEALLLITTRENPEILRMLRTEGHPCQEAMASTLEVSPSFGALDLLWHALVDSDSPDRLLQLASQRCDKPFLVRMADHVGYPIGVRTRANAERVERFAWMEEGRRDSLLNLTGNQQAVLVALAAACNAPSNEKLAFVRFMLEQAEGHGRVAACHLLRDFSSPTIPALLGKALEDDEAGVVAAAARQIRAREVPGAEAVLIGLLEHPAPEVRRAAQDELHELNLSAYRTLFWKLSEPARRAAGRLVARADPDAVLELASDLDGPIVRQQMESLAIIDAMGLVDELNGPLADALKADDAGVRAEAARLLGSTTVAPEMAHTALVAAAGDSNLTVRSAVKKSLEGLGALEQAASSVDELLREFDNEPPEQAGGDQ